MSKLDGELLDTLLAIKLVAVANVEKEKLITSEQQEKIKNLKKILDQEVKKYERIAQKRLRNDFKKLRKNLGI
jgi:hypothetical protein